MTFFHVNIFIFTKYFDLFFELSYYMRNFILEKLIGACCMSSFELPQKDILKYPVEYYYPDSDINKKAVSLEKLVEVYNNNDNKKYSEYFKDYQNAKYFKLVRDIANRILKNAGDIKTLFVELASTSYLEIDEHLYYFAFTEACILLTREDIDMIRLNLPEYNRYMKLYNKSMIVKLEG